MWIKLTIILVIITICSYIFTKGATGTMTPLELDAMVLGGRLPKKVSIPIYIMIISGIAAVVCLIITIVTW